MASKSLTFELFGIDKTASTALAGVARAGDNMAANLTKGAFVAGAALATIGVAAGAFAVESIKAFADAEQAQNRLAFAFEKYPALAGANVGALQDLNTALQKTTRFEDDAIAAAQGQLAMYDLNADQLKELTPLMLDYAAATGKDAGTAAEDLGKAIMGQGRALKGIGVDFQDAGDPLSNYTNLIGALRTQVQGFSEKDADTAAGRLDMINNQFNAVQETLGAAFAPALGLAADALQDDLIPQLDNVIGRVGPVLTQALEDAAPAVGKLLDKVTPLVEQFLIAGAEDGIPAFVDGMTEVTDAAPDWIDAFQQTDASVRDLDAGFREAQTAVADFFEPAREQVLAWADDWNQAWDRIWGSASSKSEAIKVYWKSSLDQMRADTKALQGEGNLLGAQFAQGFADGIQTNAESAAIAAENMALRTVAKVRNAMQIKSPSKVMRDLGAYIPQGLALGIEDDMWRVDAAFGQMGAATQGSRGASMASQVGAAGGVGGGLTINVAMTGIASGSTADVGQFLYRALTDAVKQGAIPKVLNA